ncbi:zinc metallopeptidase [bacterium]|nr:zinc metallopeptidase [bacterium]
MFFGDPIFFFLSLGLMALMGLASKNVQSTFQRFAEVPIRRRMSGSQAARQILDSNGLQDVAIERVQGNLTDHYDPQARVLRLSESVYDQPSVSAVGVACHEAGHALQHKVGYAPLKLRQGLLPLAQLSNFGVYMIMAGLLLGFGMSMGPMKSLAEIGLLMYSAGVVFAIITLPVEFNASSRAMAQMSAYGIVSSEEYTGARKVLNAAALTYVAAALGALIQLIYLAMMVFGGDE